MAWYIQWSILMKMLISCTMLGSWICSWARKFFLLRAQMACGLFFLQAQMASGLFLLSSSPAHAFRISSSSTSRNPGMSQYPPGLHHEMWDSLPQMASKKFKKISQNLALQLSLVGQNECSNIFRLVRVFELGSWYKWEEFWKVFCENLLSGIVREFTRPFRSNITPLIRYWRSRTPHHASMWTMRIFSGL